MFLNPDFVILQLGKILQDVLWNECPLIYLFFKGISGEKFDIF